MHVSEMGEEIRDLSHGAWAGLELGVGSHQQSPVKAKPRGIDSSSLLWTLKPSFLHYRFLEIIFQEFVLELEVRLSPIHPARQLAMTDLKRCSVLTMYSHSQRTGRFLARILP